MTTTRLSHLGITATTRSAKADNFSICSVLQSQEEAEDAKSKRKKLIREKGHHQFHKNLKDCLSRTYFDIKSQFARGLLITSYFIQFNRDEQQ